jgi:hypothetical protein
MQENSEQVEKNKHQKKEDYEANEWEGIFKGNVWVKEHGHLRVVVIAYQKPEDNAGKGRNLSKKASKDTLNHEKGDHPKDNIIKKIHVQLLPESILASQADSGNPPRFSAHLIKNIGCAKKRHMSMQKRIIIAIGIVLVDLVIFFVPLTAFFLAYVIIYNPLWVKDFLENLGSPAG